jgi:hypothetical protein
MQVLRAREIVGKGIEYHQKLQQEKSIKFRKIYQQFPINSVQIRET